MGHTESKNSNGCIKINPLEQNTADIETLTKAYDMAAQRKQQLALPGQWDSVEQDKQSFKTLKSLFKKLDPSIVKSLTEVNGEIELSFKYDIKRQLLLVKVIKCKDLPDEDIRTSSSDPYVRLQLYPDLHSHGGKVTQIVSQTTDPVYNEIFAFKMREKELVSTKLIVQVYDYDSVTSDDFLGEVIVNLSDFDFNKSPVLTAWYTLGMETDLSITGEIEVSLRFTHPDCLSVTFVGATDLSKRRDGRSPHVFVRAAIPGLGQYRNTQVCSEEMIVWNETLEFEIFKEELAFRCIVFHILDKESTGDRTLGQAVLELDILDNQSQNYHGRLKLSDLRNCEGLRDRHQQDRIGQEFREALNAHAMARYPRFLFEQQRGKKTVSLSCRKAGARGQIKILDGVPVF